MAVDKLGDKIDIHSGGIDLSFPHHDNEIARELSPPSHLFQVCIIIGVPILGPFPQLNIDMRRKSLTSQLFRKRGIFLSW